MPASLDHVFVCTAVGAPAAGRLLQLGLLEGTPNRHPGQGTANRRFFFHNAMLELLWVEDEGEAKSGPLRLWDRWSGAGLDASPFGIILRPAIGMPAACPFPSWEYRPQTMPDLVLRIAADTGVDEPLWCYAENGRAPTGQPTEHPAGVHELTGLRLVCPPLREKSVTASLAGKGIISLETGAKHCMQLEFDRTRTGGGVDLRPDLPLVMRW